MKDKRSPSLRFNDSIWEQRKLGDLQSLNSGQDYKHLKAGTIPVYGTGGYMLSVDRALSESEDAVGIGRKGTINKPFLLKAPFWTVDTLFFAVPKPNIDLEFLFGIYQRINWLSKNEATGLPSLSKTIISEQLVSLPSFSEQEKIGSLLKKLDETITLHQRKLEKLKKLKQGLLQKLFPKNDSQFPELRFPEFTAPWEQRKVQNFIDDGILVPPLDGNHGEKHPKANEYLPSGIPFLMAKDIKNGQVDLKNCNFISEERAAQLDKGFANNGDVLLTHKATIGETAILEGLKASFAVLTPQITYYRILKPHCLNPLFLLYFFRSPEFQRNIKEISTQSTRSYIGISEQRKLVISFPEKEEQEKIGAFFSKLDDTITLHQHQLETLQHIKNAFLTKMFPE